MSTRVIGLPSSSETHVRQAVTLGGRSYLMSLDYNSRTDRWTVGLSTETGVEIIRGALLAVGVDLVRTIPITLADTPQGVLMLGGADDPTEDSIANSALFFIDL